MTQLNEKTAASAIHESLKSVAVSVAQIADYARTHPLELPVALESAKSVNRQFSDLVEDSQKFAESRERLRETATEVSQAAGWIGSNYSGGGGVSVNNSFGRVVGSYGDL